MKISRTLKSSCCNKSRKINQLEYRNGYDSCRLYCKKGRGCNRWKKK